MRKLILIFAFLPLFIFTNCSDSEDNIINITEPSETEIIANKLQEFIEKEHLTSARVYVYNLQDDSFVFETGCNSFEVKDPFIQACGAYYPLSKLVKFRNNGALELYFKY